MTCDGYFGKSPNIPESARGNDEQKPNEQAPFPKSCRTEARYSRCPYGSGIAHAYSVDTVYDLLKSGQLPGRKVGRKWITTRSAVMRWVEETLVADTAQRAIDGGDKAALTKALQSGAVRVKAR